MGYRGDDLDLRTPQTWSAAPSDLGGLPQSEALLNGPRVRQGVLGFARGGSIWVDQTLLDCCNHAFDVALTHGAGEVRLEHLIHALTRIDASAEVLEVRGIRVIALRRETAIAIASEVPVGLPNDKGKPRRSEELEEVLRLAAAHAYRRNAPASVDDILHVLADGTAEASGLARLRPTLHILRSAYAAEAAEAYRERPRVYHPRESQRASRTELAGSTAGTNHNARLDVLEQIVRALSSELADERRLLSGALQDLQREVMAQRDDTTRHGGSSHDKTQSILGDRLQNLEQAQFHVWPSPSPDMSLLHDRIGALERAFQTEFADARVVLEALAAKLEPSQDYSPISHRLDVIEEAVLSRDIPERLKTVEGALAAEHARAVEAQAVLTSELRSLAAATEGQKSEIAVAILAPMKDRLDGLVATVENRQADTDEGLGKLEQTLEEHMRGAGDAQATYTEELGRVHEALVKLNANQHTLAASLESLHRESGHAAQAIGVRLEAIERASAETAEMLVALSGTVETMNKLTVERYRRRNRFWYWLFGTDDWIAASWPSQPARVAEEIKSVKPALER